ncbi:MAG: hypothetical protein NWT00_07050 [Beijerinckiaceae bacterium]|jgi:hypothetical protein|nr:hypothetical protein [Beijerinckiaceae bacterium]
MLDIALTSLIILAAAAYVLWTLVLPVRARMIVSAVVRGKPVPCEPEAETTGCAGGCAGCGLAKAVVRK